MEQLVARRAHNPKVARSSRVPATKEEGCQNWQPFLFFSQVDQVKMFQVYLLYSEKFNKIYIGFTSNLIERLKSHNELGTKGYTIKFRPWELIYTETFSEKNLALKREKELKTSRGRAFCRIEVEKYMSNKSLSSYQSKD